MRIQAVFHLVVGLVFLATLPTGLAQKAGSACVADGDCAANKCCQADNTCSRRNKGSKTGGSQVDDLCECASQTIFTDTGRCGCTDDTHCSGNKCCTVDGTCSTRDLESVLPGRQADDACECTAHGVSSGRCKCDDLNPDCLPPSCCKANNLCSNRPAGSIFSDNRAADACECVSGVYDKGNGKCGCTEDNHCPDSQCCMADGTCSKRAAGSVTAGKKAEDGCECVSRSRLDSGKCACDADEHCLDNKCCLMDGLCTSKSRGSILPGKKARDECECATRIFDVDGQRCGCTEAAHCSAKPKLPVCSEKTNVCVSATGDPHMTGFFGQKFDFTGNDNGWYALISDPPTMQINMRVTVPVPSVPETTYITGFSILTTDDDGLDHSIVVAAKTPHNMYTACPVGVSPCLADGSLTVLLDGKGALAAPGTVSLAPGIDITAVNIPGECRSFGFKAYWEKKKEDNAAYWTKMEQEGARDSRKLSATLGMGEWILDNPTATNMVDCADYVARSAELTGGLFAHQSEHASFRIVTPGTTIRLSHGKRYAVAAQDPTNAIDVPDTVAWQMNIRIDHTDVSNDAKGVLGETVVPTRGAGGAMIMHGKRCIRGEQADYAVDGPLGKNFSMDNSGPALQDALGGPFP